MLKQKNSRKENPSEITDIVITTNIPRDLSRIKIGSKYVISEAPGIFKVVELLPGCRDEECAFRHFRAKKIHLADGDSMQSVEYIKIGSSMICWEPYDP